MLRHLSIIEVGLRDEEMIVALRRAAWLDSAAAKHFFTAASNSGKNLRGKVGTSYK